MIYRLFAAAFALLMFLALSGCGSSDSSDPVVAESATIGAAGGTLDGPDGVQLIIPAGALSEPVTIRIARTSAGAPQDPPDDYTLPGAVYEITPHDLTFEVPVTIRMPAGSVPAGATVSPFTASQGETAWRRLEAGEADGILTFETLAFSWFTPGVCAPKTSDPQACVNATINPQLTATPADAATLISYEFSFNHRAWSVTKAAAMKVAFEMTAPEDCIDLNQARLTVKRRPSSTSAAATVLDQAVALVPDPTSDLRSRQTVNWDFSLSQADNGTALYDVLFTCVRSNGARRSIGGYLLFKTSIPAGPQAPAITTQPTDVTVTEPVAATFTAVATGDPAPTYQWQRSSDGTSWTDISGATTASYTTPATSASADDGSYFRVTATNTAGIATSNAAKLTVNAQVTGSWSVPETIANTQENFEPSVGFDGNGRALAVWTELNPNNGTYRILHAARSSGGVWSAPAVLTALSQVFAPRIAVAPDGQAVVAFERGSQIWAARFDGSIWSSPVPVVTQSGGSSPRNVSVGIDPNGRAIVAWVGYDGTFSRAYASVSVAGDTWTAPQALDGHDAGTPQVAVNGDGRGFVIFTERNASVQSRVTAVPVDLGATPAFGIAQPLRSFVDSTPGQKRIAVDGSGNALAVWLDTEGVLGDLVWSRFDATSGTWSTFQLLAVGVGTQVDAYARPYNLALAMNAGGDAVVVWGQNGVTDGAVSEQAIFSRRMAAGTGTWSTAERRSVNNVNVRDYAENPRVAISGAGRIAVTWISEPPSGSYAVWGQVLEGGTWQSAQAIMTSGNAIDVDAEHALAMDGSGMPLAVWGEWSSNVNPLVGAVWR